jgi:hypothetical protein
MNKAHIWTNFPKAQTYPPYDAYTPNSMRHLKDQPVSYIGMQDV